jgi:hypothetical protein
MLDVSVLGLRSAWPSRIEIGRGKLYQILCYEYNVLSIIQCNGRQGGGDELMIEKHGQYLQFFKPRTQNENVICLSYA